MRRLSKETLEAIFSQQTDKVFYILLTIDPDEEGYEPVRVYNANETENGEPKIITHKGNEFVAYPFTINLPGEGDDVSTEITLSISNVDRSITEVIRELHKPLKVRMEIVMSDDLETTEAGPWDMKLVNITGNALTIDGKIIIDRFMDEPFPKNKMDATIFPAMF